jgi:hypothetical protein
VSGEARGAVANLEQPKRAAPKLKSPGATSLDRIKVAELMPASSMYARALFDAFPEYCHVILNARGGLEDGLVADVLHAVGRRGGGLGCS